MSLSITGNFINNIYHVLSSHEEIKLLVSQVCMSVPSVPTYPFILVELNELKAQSSLTQSSYNVDFDVWLFLREKNPQIGFDIANKIDMCLIKSQTNFTDYTILGMQKQNITLSKSADALTTKLSIKYLSLIRER